MMKLNKITAALSLAFTLAGTAAFAQQEELKPENLWTWSTGRSYGLMNGCVVQEVNRMIDPHDDYNNVITRYYDFVSETVLTYVGSLKSGPYSEKLNNETPFSQLSSANVERVRAIGAQIAQNAAKSGKKYPDSVNQFLKECSTPRRNTAPTLMPKPPG